MLQPLLVGFYRIRQGGPPLERRPACHAAKSASWRSVCELVLEASLEVLPHQHPFDPVGRLAALEEDQRGQRCTQQGGAQAAAAAGSSHGQQPAAAAAGKSSRQQHYLAASHRQFGTARPGFHTSLRRRQGQAAMAGSLLVGWAATAAASAAKRLQQHATAAPGPTAARASAPESTLTKRTRFFMVGATSSMICPIIWQGLRPVWGWEQPWDAASRRRLQAPLAPGALLAGGRTRTTSRKTPPARAQSCR